MALPFWRYRRQSPRTSSTRSRQANLQCERLEPRLVLADRALSLDGATDHLEIATVATPLTEMTVEAWVYRQDAARCEAVLNGRKPGSFWFGLCNGRVLFASNDSTPGQAGTTAIPAGLWTHIAATWTVGGRQKIYVNGDLDSDVFAGAGPQPIVGADTLYVGADLINPDDVFNFTGYEFRGSLSEVRLWHVAHTAAQIRQTMNLALEESRNGLVVDLHLRDDFRDTAGDHTVTAFQQAQIAVSSTPSPALSPIAQVDANFNTIKLGGVTSRRYAAGTVYLPETDRTLLLGGFAEGIPTGQILSVEMGSGQTTLIGNLPGGRGYAAAAYAPTTGKAYVFGGALDSDISTLSGAIHTFNPATGVASTLATSLPQAMFGAAAVYHKRLDKVVILGGSTAAAVLDTILLFDPRTETLTTLPLALPEGRAHSAAAYSPVSDRIYLFGGLTLAAQSGTKSVYEVQLSADGATGVAQAFPNVSLPSNTLGQGAVVDPRTQLIHLIGGYGANEHVLAFDPVTNQLFRTMIRLPHAAVGNNGWYEGTRLAAPFASVAFSPRQNHALVIGGGNMYGAGSSYVWRIPLGEGPAVSLERWDFPTGVGATVTGIDGRDRGVYLATAGNATVGIDENGQRFSYSGSGFLPTANDVALESDGDLWISTPNFGAARVHNGQYTFYDFDEFGTNKVYATEPNWSAFGTDHGMFMPYIGFPGYGQYWNDPVAAYTDVRALASDPQGSGVWGITSTRDILEGPEGPPQLQRYYYDEFFSPHEVNYGSVCGDGTHEGDLSRYDDLVFDPSGNLWIIGAGLRNANDWDPRLVCYISADRVQSGDLGTPGKFFSFNGGQGTGVDVDSDGRAWASVETSEGRSNFPPVESGGLSVWESKGPATVSTTDYNWRNAPIGTRDYYSNGATSVWNSGFTAIGAIDEKVWAGRADGSLATVAQRWQQIDGAFFNDSVVDKIYTARGRVFLSAGFDLYVLQPDGASWDYRTLPGSKVVFGDSRGNTWVGTAGCIVPNSGSLQLYLASGWDTLNDRVGDKPAGPIYAIVESRDDNPGDSNPGPIWIGGQNGLTMFDRNRFVATFTASNSGLPSSAVKSLLVDRENRLWVGTDGGLAMLSADRTTWTTYTTANGLPNNAIFELAEVGDGRVAISTANGLSLFNGMTFATQSPPVAATNLPLTVDEGGRLWAGSAVLTANGWKGYWYTNSGLKHSTVSDNAADGADRVWFSHYPNPGVSVRGAYLPPLRDVQPVIDSVTPLWGTTGQTLTIQGGGFGANASEVTVTVGGAFVDVVEPFSNTQMQVRLNDTNVSGSVVVKRTGRSDSESGFCAVPQIKAFSPAGGNVGVEVVITGTNFDSDATIRFGDGPARKAFPVSPTQIKAVISAEDVSGAITIDNHCAGASAVSNRQFRTISLSVSEMAFNQGLSIYGIVQGKPTLVQSFVSAGGPLGFGETVEIDELQLVVTEPSGYVTNLFYTNGDIGTGVTPPFFDGPPNAAQRGDIANSLNTPSVTFREWGVSEVKAIVRRRNQIVAQSTTTVDVVPNRVTRVLLVPYMQSGSEPERLTKMRNSVDANLGELRQRIMPFGTTELFWSPEAVYDNDTFALDNVIDFQDKSHALDRARRHWNNSHGRNFQADIAFGIVDPQLIEGSKPGFAFWPDVSEMLNTIALDVVDTLCDIGDALVSVVGLSDGTGCSLDIPMYVGWAAGGPLGGENEVARKAFEAGIAATIGHELGHISNLVKPYAYNGSFGDNFSHSVNDELGGDAICTSGTKAFDWAKSLYNQPGVREPVVNPISGMQFRTQNDGRWDMARGKAIMSYACSDNNNNVFFEPVDLMSMSTSFVSLGGLFQNITVFGRGSPTAADSPAPGALAAAPRPASAPTPLPNPGPRLHISGTVNGVALTGDIRQAEVFGDDGPLTPSFASGFFLVQLDAAEIELARTGVFPVSTTESGDDPTRFFAATMIRQPGLARIELRHGESVLDAFTAGGELPIVEIIGPLAGEEFLGDDVPVSFNASDADGDDLSVVIEYSVDDGAAWMPVASATQSGVVSIPTAWLAGATGTARIRVSASDGLNTSSVISDPFTVAVQPPRTYINHTAEYLASFEGQRVALSGGAFDNQDGMVAADQLRWTSDVEGFLGTGETITAPLHTLGWHTITLEATNSHGLVSETTYAVYVEGDYDFDGIGDADELSSGFNPLGARDAYADTDGDGLSRLMEMHQGLDANNPDSDFDGRTDDVEIVEGTNPLGADEPPAPDQLVVTPTSIAMDVDLAADTPLPQQTVGILSRATADWTVTSTVDWLEASSTSGTTPGSLLLRVQAYELADGVHTAELRFTSTAIGSTVTIPLTITVANRAAWFDLTGDGQSTADDCASVQSLLGATFGDALYNRHYDINRDGMIDSQDVGTCNIAVGTATLSGDFDLDGDVDDIDIDLLFVEISTGTHTPRYDLTGDALVDHADAAHLVEVILNTRFGDANLNGYLDRADAAAVARNFGQMDTTSWARGDFNGDLRIDLYDLAILQRNLTPIDPPSAVAHVPSAIVVREPSVRVAPRMVDGAVRAIRARSNDTPISPDITPGQPSNTHVLRAARSLRTKSVDLLFSDFNALKPLDSTTSSRANQPPTANARKSLRAARN